MGWYGRVWDGMDHTTPGSAVHTTATLGLTTLGSAVYTTATLGCAQ